MREPKFRIWDRYKNEMVYGGFQLWFDGHGELKDTPPIGAYPNIELLEYTGLNDKHGKKIFEGDIVIYGVRGLQNIGRNKREHQLYGPVQWIQGSCCWWLVDKHMDAGSVYEVIGNIYENPELLPKDERI